MSKKKRPVAVAIREPLGYLRWSFGYRKSIGGHKDPSRRSRPAPGDMMAVTTTWETAGCLSNDVFAGTGQGLSRLREHVGSVLRNDPFVRRCDTPSSQASCRFRNRRRGVASGAGGVGTRRALGLPGRPTRHGRVRSLARRRSRGRMQVACTAAYLHLHCHTW